MNQTVLALVVGLVAGICGALIPTWVVERAPEGSAGIATADLRPVLERLDEIEARLEVIQPAPLLRGSSSAVAAGARDGGAADPHIDAVLARIDERIGETVREAMVETWGEMVEATPSEIPKVPEEPVTKKVTLAEAAAELELTAYEEQEVRRIHEETMDKLVELLASEEDGGVATVRRELEEARDQPQKRMELVGKYVGRVFTNLGGFIMLGQEHEQKMRKAVGPEKAKRLDDDYEITDLDPYDLEGILSDTFGD